jgi:hypothetical protein
MSPSQLGALAREALKAENHSSTRAGAFGWLRLHGRPACRLRTEGDDPVYNFIRLEGTRRGPPNQPAYEAHLFEIYWSDLARLRTAVTIWTLCLPRSQGLMARRVFKFCPGVAGDFLGHRSGSGMVGQRQVQAGRYSLCVLWWLIPVLLVLWLMSKYDRQRKGVFASSLLVLLLTGILFVWLLVPAVLPAIQEDQL